MVVAHHEDEAVVTEAAEAVEEVSKKTHNARVWGLWLTMRLQADLEIEVDVVVDEAHREAAEEHREVEVLREEVQEVESPASEAVPE